MQDQYLAHKEYLFEIGKRIAEYRIKNGLSQRKLALECAWDKSNLQRLEKGLANPTAKTLFIICGALNITVSELFKDVEKFKIATNLTNNEK